MVAPCGAGKTTAAVLYARTAAHGVRYFRVPSGGSVEAFFAACGQALGLTVSSLDAFIGALGSECREIIVDDVDVADPKLREILVRLPDELPHDVTAIYLGQERGVVDVMRGVTAGTIACCDAASFTFGAAEITALCAALGVEAAPGDVKALIAATDGWAFAVTGSVRLTAANGQPLAVAFAPWFEQHRGLLAEIAERSLAALVPEDRAAAKRMYAGEAIDSEMSARLRDAGLPGATVAGDLRPYRPIALAFRRSTVPVEPVEIRAGMVPRAAIELFGETEMTIAGRRVEWLRRRDRQIVELLALRPAGRAARADVIATFWPRSNPQLASQSLRTACSTIRRAIARCVGYDRVGQYFSTDRELRLNFANVETTARRFDELLRTADEAAACGDAATARERFLAAVRLHRAPLLDDEGDAPWTVEARRWYDDAYQRAQRAAEDLRIHRRAVPEARPERELALTS